MVYETGTANSSFDLFEKLDTFIQALSGWQLWSDISPYDKVYFSSGVDGHKDIYIRMKAKADEHFLYGLDQKPYTPDGDTGFINFFAYNYYPQGGDGYAGYGEIGILGPRFYHFTMNRSTSIGGTGIEPVRSRAYYTNLLSQKPGGGYRGIGDQQSVPGGGATGFGWSPTTQERKKWVQLSRIGDGTVKRFYGFDAMAFDGRHYFYHSVTRGSSGELDTVNRYTVSRFGGGNHGIAHRGQGVGVLHTDYDALFDGAYYSYLITEDRQTRHQMLYYMNINSSWAVHNLYNGADITLATPGYASSTVSGTKPAWDGADKIYHVRGNSTTQWAIYSISQNTWTIGVSVLPKTATSYLNNQFLFVPHYISKATNNRLYFMGDGRLYHIDLDNDSGQILGGTAVWIDTGLILEGTSSAGLLDSGEGALMWINRYGRLFVHQGQGVDVVYDKDTDSNLLISNGRPMAYTDDLATPDWKVADFHWLPEHVNTENFGWYTDAYQARVRTSVGGNTTYYAIGDSDRITISTESDGISTLCYAGAFESKSDDDTIGSLAEPIYGGHSRTVRVTNVRGSFIEGSRYFIIDVTGDEGFSSFSKIEGNSRKLVNSESVVVTSVHQDGLDYILTFSTRFDYPIGAKIGVDPQPVGLLMGDLQKFQVTNNIPERYDDFSGTDDRSAQVYSMCTNDEVVIPDSGRSGSKISWPSNFGTFEGEGLYDGKELRGSMKDVLISSRLSTGDTISINNKAYLVISTNDSSTSYLIGPLEG